MAFSVGLSSAVAASLAPAVRARRGLRLAIVAAIVLAGLAAPPASRAVAASGTTQVVQQSSVLSITVPASASLGSAAPGGTASASLGIVQVTDERGGTVGGPPRRPRPTSPPVAARRPRPSPLLASST